MNVAMTVLAGIQQASETALASAQRLRNVSSASGGGGGDVVDLSAEMVALMQARNLNAAMVSVVQTAEEMDSEVLNILG